MSRDWQSIPVPGALAERPRDDRGFPITFVTLITSDGRPDFTTIDGQKILRCIQEGLCGMCGMDLDLDPHGDAGNTTSAFIGGPLSIENRNFLDPPMHEWCASYAMQVCPHIAIDTSRYSKPKLDDGEGRELYQGVADERPERFGMLVVETQYIRLARHQGQPVFLVDPVGGVEGELEVRWQDEPQVDEEGHELVPYWETRRWEIEPHEKDGEPCPVDTTIVTTGRHRKNAPDEFLMVICANCSVGAKLNRVEV